jgi:chemotaxis protein MotA
MFVIIGFIVVIGAILGGYLMEHGHIAVLLQPAELIIIGGAAIGTIIAANPLHILNQIVGGILAALKGSRFNKQLYLDLLKLLSELYTRARREGLVAMESDIEEPDKSAVFSKYPQFLKDHHVKYFICDTMRLVVTGGIDPYEIDAMMEADIEVHHHENSLPVTSLSTMADSLPGLGIVAAVLGVVITMGALGGPPEEIGHKVAAALVGTFLGILLCYGFIGPLASNMNKIADEEHAFFNVIRISLITFIKGNPPIISVEMARRSIPGHVRPTFLEMEAYCKGQAAAAAAAGGAPAEG